MRNNIINQCLILIFYVKNLKYSVYHKESLLPYCDTGWKMNIKQNEADSTHTKSTAIIFLNLSLLLRRSPLIRPEFFSFKHLCLYHVHFEVSEFMLMKWRNHAENEKMLELTLRN